MVCSRHIYLIILPQKHLLVIVRVVDGCWHEMSFPWKRGSLSRGCEASRMTRTCRWVVGMRPNKILDEERGVATRRSMYMAHATYERQSNDLFSPPFCFHSSLRSTASLFFFLLLGRDGAVRRCSRRKLSFSVIFLASGTVMKCSTCRK